MNNKLESIKGHVNNIAELTVNPLKICLVYLLPKTEYTVNHFTVSFYLDYWSNLKHEALSSSVGDSSTQAPRIVITIHKISDTVNVNVQGYTIEDKNIRTSTGLRVINFVLPLDIKFDNFIEVIDYSLNKNFIKQGDLLRFVDSDYLYYFETSFQ